MKKEEAQELLKKYRLGQCTEKEIQIINRWYESFDKVEPDLSDEELDNLRLQMHKHITNKIDQAEKNIGSTQVQKKRLGQNYFLNFRNLKKLAAILIVGVGCVIFFSKKEIKNLNEDKPFVEEVSFSEKAPSTVYLSDGTVVWLKEDSKIAHPNSFTGNIREVTLFGEAFFDVAKDPEKPFIIHSTHLTTRVVGTKFNIKAYQNDEFQEVAVVTGEVIVSVKKKTSDKLEEVVLKPSQKAIYSKKDSSLIESSGVENKNYTPLMKSKLVFNETSLENIIMVLNATHNANISVANEDMKKCIITADLTGESLETSIEIISRTINAKYSVDEKGITLRGNGCW